MNKKRIFITCLTVILLAACVPAGWWVYRHNRPFPLPEQATLFRGVTYQREIWSSPRPVTIHVVTVDLDEPGVGTLVTPGDPDAELPLQARTTSEFMRGFGVQVAVNGDFFSPWYSNTFFDYYPHPNDPVDVLGLAASQGEIYSPSSTNGPTLYLSRANKAAFDNPTGTIYNAVSGFPMLLRTGNVVRGLDDNNVGPRTAVALNRSKRYLILVVVDGRQPGYSEGVTLAELAEILVRFAGYSGMNLDGGGSTALVVQGTFGPVVVNRPIDRGLPGTERAVGNHLGIFARPEK